MKIAEKYFYELETYNQVNEQPMLCLSPIALKATIKQIQLDAYKQGMIDAAEICKSTLDENGEGGASECAERILTAANSLTKLSE